MLWCFMTCKQKICIISLTTMWEWIQVHFINSLAKSNHVMKNFRVLPNIHMTGCCSSLHSSLIPAFHHIFTLPTKFVGHVASFTLSYVRSKLMRNWKYWPLKVLLKRIQRKNVTRPTILTVTETLSMSVKSCVKAQKTSWLKITMQKSKLHQKKADKKNP